MEILDKTGLVNYTSLLKSAITDGTIKAGKASVADSANSVAWSNVTNKTNASTSAAGLMSASDKSKLDGIAAGANAYSLPTASSSTLGGVKTGSNITNSSGTISVTKSNVTSALGYTPPTTTEVNSAIASAVGDITSFEYEVVTALPDTGVKGVIYLIADTHSDSNDSYDEYIWLTDSSAYEKIGNTDVDLSGYVPTSRTVNGHALTSNVTVTKSDLGLGNVTNYDASSAIKSITRSGTTFTYTTLAGNTGTFTQQDNNTWTALKGATSSAAGTAGYAPAPASGDQGKFLRGDATWQTVSKSTVGLGNVANYDLSKAIKSITRSGTTFTATALDGTTSTFTQQDNNTWTALKGATSSAAGTAGYVPAPAAGDQAKFLRGDGTWAADNNTTYSVATTSANGLMSSSDKTKLDGIATGAQVNQNAFSNITVGSTTVAADSTTDTLTLAAGSNITLTPDATNDKITIAATNTTYSAATTSAAGLMSASDKSKLDGITSSADSVSYTASATSGNKVGTITINGTATDMYSPTQTTVSGNAGTATKLATARTLTIGNSGKSFDGSGNVSWSIFETGGVGVYNRSQIGTSPNYDNPGVNGLFEIRASSEVTGESGTRPFSGFGPFLSLKTSDNIAMMQIAGTGTTWYIRGKQSANVTMESLAWNQIALTTSSITGNAATATAFQSAKSVALTGDVTGSASSTGGWSVATTLANSGVTAGTYGPSANVTGSNGTTITVPQITVDAKGRVTSVTNRTYTSVNTDNNTTYGIATNSTSGLIKPWYNHTAASTGPTAGSDSTAVAVNTITSTSGKYYAIESDSNGRLFVNVPWSNTTYSSLKNPNALTVQYGGTTSYTYDGSAAKTLNIKAGSNVTVSGDASGNITIASSYTNTTYTKGTYNYLGLIKPSKSYTAAATLTTAAATASTAPTIAAITTTSGRYYAVEMDSNGVPFVNVPWTNTNTTYSAGTGLSLSGTTFNHSNSVTAGTAGTSSATSGATLAVPYVTYDAQGHITATGTHTHTIGSLNTSALTAGTLGVARGGTGITSNPSMLVNLASTSAASVFATSPRPGVTGTLPIANGGTGATTAAAALTNLRTSVTNSTTSVTLASNVYTRLTAVTSSTTADVAITITLGTATSGAQNLYEGSFTTGTGTTTVTWPSDVNWGDADLTISTSTHYEFSIRDEEGTLYGIIYAWS